MAGSEQTHPALPAPCPNPPESMALPERHQAALRHIHSLEAHNSKLYEDNCRLVNTVNFLSDRLAFLNTPQNAQVHRLSEMQERLRATDENRALINRKYQDLLQSVSTGSAHHHVYAELQAIRDAYTSLDHEYRLLREKYARLKAVADSTCVAHQQPQVSHDQTPINAAFYRRRSSENTTVLRSGPTCVPTTWLAPLPTPPPSASLPPNQVSPTGFPVHAPVPAGSLPLPHHARMPHNPHTVAVTEHRRLAEQGTPVQLKPAIHLVQNHQDSTVVVKNESGQHIATSAAPESSPPTHKRPISELQTSPSPSREHKKPRTEEAVVHPTVMNADTGEKLPVPAPTDLRDDHKSSGSGLDARSYQDRVNIIFEKDADVENGIFCGLCLDRYQADMIPEPPDVLIQPDFDFLVEHCKTTHPTVWEELRLKA